MSRWRGNLKPWAAWTATLTLFFAAVYGSANWLASVRADSYRFHAEWELAAPFVPWMIYPYLSLSAAALLPLFTLERRELRPLAAAFALATLAGGAIFVLFPAQAGFARPPSVPGHEAAFGLLYALDQPYNTLPSLHVAFAILWIFPTARRASPLARLALGVWLAAMVASVLLIHQHHLADIATGAALGLACYACFRKWAAREAMSAPESRQAWQGSAR